MTSQWFVISLPIDPCPFSFKRHHLFTQTSGFRELPEGIVKNCEHHHHCSQHPPRPKVDTCRQPSGRSRSYALISVLPASFGRTCRQTPCLQTVLHRDIFQLWLKAKTEGDLQQVVGHCHAFQAPHELVAKGQRLQSVRHV